MSSPIGHSLAGYVISSYRSKSLKPENLKILAFYIFIANAPDLDFVPGFLIGKPNLYHHGISHSIGIGILISILLPIFINMKKKKFAKRDFLIILVLYSSHLLLDLFSIDGRPPLGIPFLWPVSDKYFMIPLLPPVWHSSLDHATIGQFMAGIFSMHNFYVIFLEVTLAIPFVLMIWFLNASYSRGNDKSPSTNRK